jgi:hexosaminidase
MQPYHKQLMFWGDIAVKYPELLSILPKDMIAVPWDYESQAQLRKHHYPLHQRRPARCGRAGAGNWGVIWPDLESAFVNIRNFVRDGQKHQALGVSTPPGTTTANLSST